LNQSKTTNIIKLLPINADFETWRSLRPALIWKPSFGCQERTILSVATELAQELKLEPNDALAIDIMKQDNIAQIYTFDEDFNNIPETAKLPES
jgi:predicted nucleic acid-binding protein